MTQLKLSLIFTFVSVLLLSAEDMYSNTEFSIKPLYSSSNQQVQPLAMFLPASDGFSPNINIQKQPFAGSLKEYIATSKQQFNQFNLEIVNEKATQEKWIIEYRGEMGGLTLHWYAEAYKKGETVFLITATTKESQWAQNKKLLIESVSSFKLK